MRLITSFVFSRLYYCADVWLIPNLKKELFDKIMSFLSSVLRIFNPLMSNEDIHTYTGRANPIAYCRYMTALNLFDLINREEPTLEFANLNFNIQLNDRNPFLNFTSNNNYRVGNNCLSNRFIPINNTIRFDGFYDKIPSDKIPKLKKIPKCKNSQNTEFKNLHQNP